MALSKLRLGQLKPADGTATVGDLHFPKVKLLLPFDGSNGATSTTDSSNTNNSVTFAGTAQISTAQSKFGGSSLLLDGNSDYLEVTNSELDLDGATCTIEFWVYLLGGVGSHICFYSDYSGASSGISIEKNSSNVIKANLSGDGADITGTTTMSTGQWYHVALSGSDGSYKLFLNGTQEGSTATGSITNGHNTKKIGVFWYSGGGYIRYWNGYLEDFRITKGLARYTSNFTPPTSAHSTQAGDINKHIVVNSSADGVAIGTGGINQARIAKAWADIDGTQTAANQIESSYNISSMTDHGSAQFSFNFATAMADANYSVVGGVGIDGGGASSVAALLIKDKTTALVKLHARYVQSSGASNDYDYNIICMQVFGN